MNLLDNKLEESITAKLQIPEAMPAFEDITSINGLDLAIKNEFEKPSFTPSLLVNAARLPHTPRCHLFVTDGFIRYLADCTHDLAGQTIEMQPIE